jgi:hypothetical protein
MAKPNKYDAVLPGLPKLPPADAGRQEQVDRVKEAVVHRDPVGMADDYVALREKKDALKAQLSRLEVMIDAYEQLLAASQEDGADGWGRYGVKANALRLPTGDTIRIQPEPYGKVVDKETFRLWCLANGYERQLQLWPSTTNAVVRERLLRGEPEPDGTEAYAYTKVVLVRKGEE